MARLTHEELITAFTDVLSPDGEIAIYGPVDLYGFAAHDAARVLADSWVDVLLEGRTDLRACMLTDLGEFRQRWNCWIAALALHIEALEALVSEHAND
jgi:short subunit dehydrogenase-like uncharacterized protein